MDSSPPPATDRSKRAPRLETSQTLVAVPGVASGGTARLVNLSPSGACVEIDGVVKPGDALELKLAHPRLRVVPSVPGEVVWVSETDSTTRIGLRFSNPEEGGRVSRPFLTAEAGSCVFEDDTLAGFVVAHGKARTTWSLFDVSGKRLSIATRAANGYEVRVKAGGEPEHTCDSLCDVISRVLKIAEDLTLEPKISGWKDRPGVRAPADAAPEAAADAAPEAAADAASVAAADAAPEAAADAAPEAPASVAPAAEVPPAPTAEALLAPLARAQPAPLVEPARSAPAPPTTTPAQGTSRTVLEASLEVAARTTPSQSGGALSWLTLLVAVALGGYVAYSIWELIEVYTR